MIVKLQSDLVNSKGSVLPVCDRHCHTNVRKLQKGEEKFSGTVDYAIGTIYV